MEQELDRLIEVGTVSAWLEEENFADDAEHVFAAFAWRDEFLDGIAEQDEAHLVVVANGGEGEHRCDFGGEFAFGLIARAEQTGPTHVDKQHQGEFAFFDEFFHEGMIHSGGHVPIDRAHFIARLIFTDLLEIHSLAFEHAVVSAR